jgi:hypothetical protein
MEVLEDYMEVRVAAAVAQEMDFYLGLAVMERKV